MPSFTVMAAVALIAISFLMGNSYAKRQCEADRQREAAAAHAALAAAIEREQLLARDIAEAATKRVEDDALALADMETILNALSQEEAAAPAIVTHDNTSPTVVSTCAIDPVFAVRVRQLDAHNPKAHTPRTTK